MLKTISIQFLLVYSSIGWLLKNKALDGPLLVIDTNKERFLYYLIQGFGALINLGEQSRLPKSCDIILELWKELAYVDWIKVQPSTDIYKTSHSSITNLLLLWIIVWFLSEERLETISHVVLEKIKPKTACPTSNEEILLATLPILWICRKLNERDFYPPSIRRNIVLFLII